MASMMYGFISHPTEKPKKSNTMEMKMMKNIEKGMIVVQLMNILLSSTVLYIFWVGGWW